MPRAKKVDSVKKDEDLVTVEMTEKEKKEFAKFMADKEDKGEEKEPEPMAYGELRFAHFINGDPYGPGKFQAPRDVAMNLIAADEKYLRRKMKEKERIHDRHPSPRTWSHHTHRKRRLVCMMTLALLIAALAYVAANIYDRIQKKIAYSVHVQGKTESDEVMDFTVILYQKESIESWKQRLETAFELKEWRLQYQNKRMQELDAELKQKIEEAKKAK